MLFHQTYFLPLVESWPVEHKALASAFKRAFVDVREAAEAANNVYWNSTFTAVSSAAFNELGVAILDYVKNLGPEGPAEVTCLPGFFLAFDAVSASSQLLVKTLPVLLSSPASREGWLENLHSSYRTPDGFLLSPPASEFASAWARRLRGENLLLLWGAVKAEVEAFVIPNDADPHQTKWAHGVLNLSHPRVRSMLARAFLTEVGADQALADELSFFDPYPDLDLQCGFSANALARYFQASDPWAFKDGCAMHGIDDALVAALVPGWLGSAAEFFMAAQNLTADAH